MRTASLLAAGLVLGLGSLEASAVPAPRSAPGEVGPFAEPVAPWRYHRGCGWRGGRWVVDLGAGKIVACRPNRPGRNWEWHREGGHEGWWDRRRRVWHYNQW